MPLARNHMQQNFTPDFSNDYSPRGREIQARKTDDANYKTIAFPVKRCPECNKVFEIYKESGHKPKIHIYTENFININLESKVCPECE